MRRVPPRLQGAFAFAAGLAAAFLLLSPEAPLSRLAADEPPSLVVRVRNASGGPLGVSVELLQGGVVLWSGTLDPRPGSTAEKAFHGLADDAHVVRLAWAVQGTRDRSMAQEEWLVHTANCRGADVLEVVLDGRAEPASEPGVDRPEWRHACA